MARAATIAALVALVAASLALRVSHLGQGLWMDEGIAVGIASHPLTSIPSVLRLDGSPPLYYLLLHGWMAVAGRSEVAVHALSLLFALLAVPVAWWAGAMAFDRRTGWALAALVACSPFLTGYAQQARMYSLVILLALVCLGLFAGAYVRDRRAFAAPFGVALALVLYTHNWALLLAAAFVAAFALVLHAAPGERRRPLLESGALGFGLAALLYLPWLPSLLFQVRHTGAPWAIAPPPSALLAAPADVLGGTVAAIAAAVAVVAAVLAREPPRSRAPWVQGPGMVAAGALARRRPRARSAGWPATLAAAVLVVLAVVPVLLAWTLSQLAPAWDPRYLAIVVAPVLMLVAVAVVRARVVGLVVLAVLVAVSLPARGPVATSNVDALARAARPLLRPGDLVLSAPPAQMPVLAYYLPPGLRYASPLGPARDPRVMDWRDVVARLRRSSTGADLAPLLDAIAPGGRVLLVLPARWDARSARTVYGRRVRRRAASDEARLRADRRFALVAALGPRPGAPDGTSSLRALLFRRVAGVSRAPAARRARPAAGAGARAADRARSGAR